MELEDEGWMRMLFLQRQDPHNKAWASLVAALVLLYVLRTTELLWQSTQYWQGGGTTV